MTKPTTIIIALIILMALSLWLNPAKARSQEVEQGFHFGLSDKMDIVDTQKYLRPFRSGEVLLGTGVCYGPFFTAKYSGRWLLDGLSVCAIGAVSQTGETTATGGLDLINLFGLQAGLQYDPLTGKPYFTFGISVTGLAKQMLK